MKIAVTSDLWAGLFDFEDSVDTFIVCGNICPIWDREPFGYNITKQSEWIEKTLNPWLGKLNTDNILLLAGPNDFSAQHYGSNLSFYLNGNYIQDEPITVRQKVFYAMPWIPSHYVEPDDHCAFKSKSGELFNLALDSINNNTDVLLTYVPPRTSYDRESDMLSGNKMRGDIFLKKKIDELKKLQLCVYGMPSCEKDTSIIKKSRAIGNPYRVFEL